MLNPQFGYDELVEEVGKLLKNLKRRRPSKWKAADVTRTSEEIVTFVIQHGNKVLEIELDKIRNRNG